MTRLRGHSQSINVLTRFDSSLLFNTQPTLMIRPQTRWKEQLDIPRNTDTMSEANVPANETKPSLPFIGTRIYEGVRTAVTDDTASTDTASAAGMTERGTAMVPVPPPPGLPGFIDWEGAYHKILSDGPCAGMKIPHPPAWWPMTADWNSTYQRIFPLHSSAPPPGTARVQPTAAHVTGDARINGAQFINSQTNTATQNYAPAAAHSAAAGSGIVAYGGGTFITAPHGGSTTMEAIQHGYFGARGEKGSLFYYANPIKWSGRNNPGPVKIPRDFLVTNRSLKNDARKVRHFYHLRCELITDQGFARAPHDYDAPFDFALTLDKWSAETCAWARPQVIRFMSQHAFDRFGWNHQGQVAMNLAQLGQAFINIGGELQNRATKNRLTVDDVKEIVIDERQQQLYYLVYELWNTKYNAWLCDAGGLTAKVLDDNNLYYEDIGVLREDRVRVTTNRLDCISGLIKSRVLPGIRDSLQQVAKTTFDYYIQNRDTGKKNTRIARIQTITGEHMGYKAMCKDTPFLDNNSRRTESATSNTAPTKFPAPQFSQVPTITMQDAATRPMTMYNGSGHSVVPHDTGTNFPQSGNAPKPPANSQGTFEGTGLATAPNDTSTNFPQSGNAPKPPANSQGTFEGTGLGSASSQTTRSDPSMPAYSNVGPSATQRQLTYGETNSRAGSVGYGQTDWARSVSRELGVRRQSLTPSDWATVQQRHGTVHHSQQRNNGAVQLPGQITIGTSGDVTDYNLQTYPATTFDANDVFDPLLETHTHHSALDPEDAVGKEVIGGQSNGVVGKEVFEENANGVADGPSGGQPTTKRASSWAEAGKKDSTTNLTASTESTKNGADKQKRAPVQKKRKLTQKNTKPKTPRKKIPPKTTTPAEKKSEPKSPDSATKSLKRGKKSMSISVLRTGVTLSDY